jgi:peptidyl-prolyl cis-trans isomerase D
MLKAMRKHAKYFYVLFFIVILSFIFWGIGTVDKRGGHDVVVEVGKYKITAEEYWKTYENIERFYREIYKGKFDEEMEKKMKLREKVLDSLIDEQILLIAAKEAGITVSDEELHEAITHEPAFMRDGGFDLTVYYNRLRLNRVTVDEYERSKRQELTINKMKRLIELSIDVPDIGSQLKQASGNEQLMNMLREQLLNVEREKAVRSYIEGFKKKIKIKVNTNLIS